MTAPGARTLIKAVNGKRHEVNGQAGKQSYYLSGDGPPALLLHSINASGSAYEMRPIYEHLGASHRVYAPDLPGFGFSDRSPRTYDVRLYVDAIHDMLAQIEKDCGDTPVDAVALSLSSEFLARAITEAPSRARSLTMITPTGFRAGSGKLREPAGTTREVPLLHAALTFPLWRRALYRALVRPRSIRYFLRRTWGSEDIDEGLAAYDDVTAHQPGAEHAPYAFLSGRLFSRDIRDVYEKLTLPVWLPHGTRGDFSDFRGADWTRERDNWQVQPFDAGALPHFERPQQFFDSLDAFLDGVDDPKR